MTSRSRAPRGVLLAASLVLLGALVAWLCFRATVVRALPSGSPLAARIAPSHPETVLDAAVLELVSKKGIVRPETLARVRGASLDAPLDARPYLVLGHQKLLEGRNKQALAILEAGRRLDPRQRLIHMLLLDRYLRSGQYQAAAQEFSVMSRLVGATQSTIAAALARMSVAKETREAVRRTLRTDPQLEAAVLTSLARSDTDASLIFSLASPTARAIAGTPNGWGSTLVATMVGRGEYVAARRLWQRIYGLSDARLASPIFNAELRESTASAPFNWTVAANGTGAANITNGKLTVDYYGRETGEIASQLLVLRPGTYRFSLALGGSPTGAGTTLSWSLTCAGGGRSVLLNWVLPPVDAKLRRITNRLVVPQDCPAQNLVLSGNAGEFPAPITATIEALSLTSIGLL